MQSAMRTNRGSTPTLEDWAHHLQTLGSRGRPVDGGQADFPSAWPPLWAVRPTHGLPPERGTSPPRGDGEVRLWRTLERASIGEACARLTENDLEVDLAASGPLWGRDQWDAIEVWTEAELCSLHALGRAMRVVPHLAPLIRQRMVRAIVWHLEHTQPDNATNRPWAAHIFFLHDVQNGVPEARLYAETLVHNAQAQGLADPVSRWVLADAGRELELWSAPASPDRG
jgi:hypothetical protein